MSKATELCYHSDWRFFEDLSKGHEFIGFILIFQWQTEGQTKSSFFFAMVKTVQCNLKPEHIWVCQYTWYQNFTLSE